MEFVINTAAHKRWTLPDGRFQINSVIYGDRCRVSVIDSHHIHPEQLVFYIDITKPNFQYLHDEYVARAEKRFPNRSIRRAPEILQGPKRR